MQIENIKSSVTNKGKERLNYDSKRIKFKD